MQITLFPVAQGRIQDFGMGAQVERRKHEYRGTAGTERGEVWGGSVPLPNGGKVWGGTVPFHRKFFNFLARNGAF